MKNYAANPVLRGTRNRETEFRTIGACDREKVINDDRMNLRR